MFSGGVWITMVTPFDKAGKLDENSLRRLADFYIDSGVHGLSLGVLSEVDMLSTEEKNRVVQILVERANKKVPVNVVCTAQSTKAAIQLAIDAEKLGAQSVMIAPPNNWNNDNVLFEHYLEISKNISIPIIVQDNPSATGTIMSPQFLARLAEQIKGIEYVKLEESPTTVKITEVLEQTDRLKIIGGSAMFYYEELARGAIGTMSSFPFPEVLVKIHQLFAKGDKTMAKQYFYEKLPLIRYEEVLFPTLLDCATITKEIFRLRGVIESSHLRAWTNSMDEKMHAELKQTIADAGLMLS